MSANSAKSQPATMRNFFFVWFGQLISTLGSGLTSFALGVWIYLETGSTTLFAINLLAFTLPSVLLSPFLGSLVDRWDRRWVMIINDAASAVTTLFILILLYTGHLEVWHIYLATFLNSAFNTSQWIAYSSSVTMLVPKEQLGRAGGMDQVGGSISMLVAPFVAGSLFVSIGLQGIILIDFVTFAIAVITLLLIRIPRPEKVEQDDEKERTIFQDAIFGWKYIFRRRGLFALIIYFAGIHFVVGMIEVLLQPMLLDMTTPETMGIMLSSMGFGALGGTLLMSLWGGPKRRILGILITGIFQGFILFGFGVSISLVVITGAIFVFSLLDPIVSGSSQAFWQSKIPPAIQGRVFAVRRMTSRFTISLAIVVAGPLADNVFEPLFEDGGALAASIGSFIGTGAGRGTGFLFVLLGLAFTIMSIIGLAYPPLRNVEILDSTSDEDAEITTPS
ncbi:MAG: MFS transporter [Anaerolineaceae bacterium]|nr:MFS transporter [Anaerolineaceae bacterium]